MSHLDIVLLSSLVELRLYLAMLLAFHFRAPLQFESFEFLNCESQRLGSGASLRTTGALLQFYCFLFVKESPGKTMRLIRSPADPSNTDDTGLDSIG